ncbi:MAG: hypothetical protein EBS98_10470 [Chitinophagia bacterium]|nr:hypothetical protein [Chitinophagia bacterium]
MSQHILSEPKDKSWEALGKGNQFLGDPSLVLADEQAIAHGAYFDLSKGPIYLGAGVEIEIQPAFGLPAAKSQPTFFKQLATDVGLVKLFPGINLNAYASVFEVKTHAAVVIESFGAGNTPNDTAFTNTLNQYVSQGGVLVTISQCTSGSVKPGKYASGKLLEKLGAWDGKNLTTEAAITKLMWMFGQDPRPLRQRFEASVCGESD